MKCEKCHKNEATQAVPATVDGHDSTLFLCDECAGKGGGDRRESSRQPEQNGPERNGPLNDAPTPLAAGALPPGLSDALLDLARFFQSMQGGKDGESKTPPVFEFHLKGIPLPHASSDSPGPSGGTDSNGEILHCPVCGLTFDQLLDTRRLGCPECYKTFRDAVLRFTGELQYDDRHVGLAPRRVLAARELADLAQKFKEAVSEQNFRRADAIAAKIRKLGGTPPALE